MKVLSGLIEPNNGGKGGPPPPVASVFHSLDPLERTTLQINQLRSIVELSGQLAAQTRSPTEGAEIHHDVYEAAAKTTTMALAQLDNILDDQARWSRADSENEQTAKRILEAERARAEAEAARHRESIRPCHLFKARLFRTPGGAFLAINETESLHAYGDTAYDALMNFDKAFFEQRHAPVAVAPEPATPEPKTMSPKRRRPPKK